MMPVSEQDRDPNSRVLVRTVSAAIPALIYIVAVLVFIKDNYALLDFPLDDAWIHRVYSRALAYGHGFAYNVGQQEAGSTSPLWSVVSAPAHWLGVLGTDAVVLAVKVIGVFLGLVSVLTVQRVAYRLSGSRLAAVLAASLFGLEPRLLFSALSGMETCLLVSVLTGACLMLTEKRPLSFLLLLGLAPVVRPEAMILLPFSLAGIVMILRTDRGILAKVASCCVPILPSGLWAGFCLCVTGHIFPNTFYLKAHHFVLGVPELKVGVNAIAQHGLFAPWLILAGISAFGLLCLKRTTHSLPSFMLFVAAPVLYVLGVVGSRRILLEGYYWTRWIDPASILITAAVCMGCSFLLTLAFDNVKDRFGKVALSWQSRIKILISSVSLVCLLLSLPSFVDAFSDRRDHLASDSRVIATMNVQMGRWIHENSARDSVVGVNDAGAIRYFGGRHTVDLLGLNNADIAFGKVGKEEAIAGTDWLVIFPELFRRGGKLAQILEEFEPRIEITMPLEEYTICNEPGQTQKVAFQKKTPTLRSSGRDTSRR